MHLTSILCASVYETVFNLLIQGGGKYEGPSWYKYSPSGYGAFHYNDKTVVRASYLYDGGPHTDTTTTLYRYGPQHHNAGPEQW